MKRLVGILTLAAAVAVGCQGRSPGTPKPTFSESVATSKLNEINKTDINSYPAGSADYNKSEALNHIRFLNQYIKDNQYVLRVAKHKKLHLEHKEKLEANIQTAKALLKSHYERQAQLAKEPKGADSYGYL